MKSIIERIVAILFLISSSMLALAQGQANIWYFGQNAGLNFNSGTPVAITNGALVTIEGCASICDASGNLLFYTDGQTIYDKGHVAMPNGTGLFGRTSSTQTAMIVAVPGSTTQYYVFTTDAEPNPCSTEGASIAGTKKGSNYSIVDMSLAGNGTVLAPRGDVIVGKKNLTLQADPIMECLGLVPNPTNTGYWVITHDVGVGNFRTNLVTSGATPVGPDVVSTVGYNTNDACKYISSVKSNSCYNRIAIVYHEYGVIDILNFDNSTGQVTGLVREITGLTFPYGIEFSPNGNYLYYNDDIYTAGTGQKVYQYDIAAGTSTLIGSAPPSHARAGALQLGPDGKIYMANLNWSGSTFISRIGSPDVAGAGSNYVASAIAMGSSSSNISQMGLPTFIKGYITGNVNITNPGPQCSGTSVPLSFTFSGSASSFRWDYTNDGTWDNTTNNPTSNTYTVASPTLFTVKAQVTDACSNNYSDTVKFLVYPNVSAAGTVSCPNTGNVTSPNGAYTYVWYSDAAGTKPIATGTTNVSLPISGTGSVYVKAQSAASSSTSTNNLITSSNSMNSNAAGNTVSVNFTVTNPITLNSFKWYPQQTWGGAGTDVRNATISIVDQATGTTVYWTNTRSITFGNTPAQITESPAILLPAGTYTIKWTSTAAVLSSWSTPNTPSSDANASITSNTNYLGFFNYTVTNYTVTNLPCSTISAAINYNCPLPVSWLNFTGVHTKSGNQLNWSTATEINSNRFEVERSFDGVNFEYVGVVAAAGNSNRAIPYQYTDAFDASGVVYYRLKQIDIDGQYDYSRTVIVNAEASNVYSLLPNPGNGLVFIDGGDASEVLTVNVLDVQGRTVKSSISAHSGSSVDLTGLTRGVYLVQIIGSGSVQTLRYVLQ